MDLMDVAMFFTRNGKRRPLYVLTQTVSQLALSEPVDKVYAVLGLVDTIHCRHIKVDDSRKNCERYWNVHIDLGHAVLQERPDLLLLTMASSKDELAELPSWCPNFNRVPEVRVSYPEVLFC